MEDLRLHLDRLRRHAIDRIDGAQHDLSPVLLRVPKGMLITGNCQTLLLESGFVRDVSHDGIGAAETVAAAPVKARRAAAASAPIGTEVD